MNYFIVISYYVNNNIMLVFKPIKASTMICGATLRDFLVYDNTNCIVGIICVNFNGVIKINNIIAKNSIKDKIYNDFWNSQFVQNYINEHKYNTLLYSHGGNPVINVVYDTSNIEYEDLTHMIIDFKSNELYFNEESHSDYDDNEIKLLSHNIKMSCQMCILIPIHTRLNYNENNNFDQVREVFLLLIDFIMVGIVYCRKIKKNNQFIMTKIQISFTYSVDYAKQYECDLCVLTELIMSLLHNVSDYKASNYNYCDLIGSDYDDCKLNIQFDLRKLKYDINANRSALLFSTP